MTTMTDGQTDYFTPCACARDKYVWYLVELTGDSENYSYVQSATQSTVNWMSVHPYGFIDYFIFVVGSAACVWEEDQVC